MIIRKQKQPWPYANLLHKGFVLSCVGASLYGVYGLSSFVYYYVTKTRPRLHQKEKKLLEGEATAAEFLADNAKSIGS